MKIAIPIILTVVYTGGLWLAGNLSKKLGLTLSDNSYVNGQVNYQIILLIITGLSLLTSYLINRENFLEYFSFGQVSVSGEELKLFGIKQGDSCLLYTSPSPRDRQKSRMPSSA